MLPPETMLAVRVARTVARMTRARVRLSMPEIHWRPRLSKVAWLALCVAVGLSVLACSGTMSRSSELAAVKAERDKFKQKQQDLENFLKQQVLAKHQLQRKLAKLKPRESDRQAKLDLRLLEKETQLDDLNRRLEEAILEVVRAKAKLRSVGSKAEAASNLAEAEIAVKALKAKTAAGARNSRSAKAEELLRLGAAEFKKKNYSGALYLSGQVKSLIHEGQERSIRRQRLPLFPGEVAFVLPLPLRAQETGTLMDGPGDKFKAIGTLREGAQVIGHSYKDQWIRVQAEDGLTGWVPYKLIKGQ